MHSVVEELQPKKLTQKIAKDFARSLGYSLNKNDWGEFRVAPTHLPGLTTQQIEDQAYYTSDLQDAVDTCRYDYEWRVKHGKPEVQGR